MQIDTRSDPLPIELPLHWQPHSAHARILGVVVGLSRRLPPTQNPSPQVGLTFLPPPLSMLSSCLVVLLPSRVRAWMSLLTTATWFPASGLFFPSLPSIGFQSSLNRQMAMPFSCLGRPSPTVTYLTQHPERLGSTLIFCPPQPLPQSDSTVTARVSPTFHGVLCV